MKRKRLAIIYLIDGARPDVLGELLDAGELPNIQREIVAPGTQRTASSCLPSTTGPAHLPFLTGCFPGTLNIPGIRWLDKAVYRRGGVWDRRSFRSYNGIEALYMNSDLPAERKTVFELTPRPFAIYSLITRGLPGGHDLTQRSKPLMYLYAHLTDRWNPVDRLAHRRLMACLERDPDFIFVVFPGVDSYSHLHHPRDRRTLEAYRFVDRSVGEVARRLKRQGRWEETLVVITSDHGLTATTKHLDLAEFLDRRGLRTLSYPKVWRRRPSAAVMISGNAVGKVTFLGDRSCDPLEGAAVPGALGAVWDELLEREEVDFLAWREGAGRIAIQARRGRAIIERTPEGLTHRPVQGDPLGLGELAEPLSDLAALEATFDSDYPDALVQLEQFFGSPRSGDLLVVAQNGFDMRRAFEWPEHHSSHGSLHRLHMIVPLIYNRTGWDPRPARTVDVYNTVLKWLGVSPAGRTDGRDLS